MSNTLIYSAGTTEAIRYAGTLLHKYGFSLIDHPAPEITHLLLDVPSFQKDGALRNGGEIRNLLAMLPHDITVVGGNLGHSALEGYRMIDLLQDPLYLAENAAITAECAIQIAAPLLKTTFADTPTLIIGWGRIGKCLAKMLKAIGCPVTVSARKKSDRAMLTALGYSCTNIAENPRDLHNFRLLFNTVPELILRDHDLSPAKDCIKIELSSTDGMECQDVIVARGLPGRYVPESSGHLIARTFVRLYKKEEET